PRLVPAHLQLVSDVVSGPANLSGTVNEIPDSWAHNLSGADTRETWFSAGERVADYGVADLEMDEQSHLTAGAFVYYTAPPTSDLAGSVVAQRVVKFKIAPDPGDVLGEPVAGVAVSPGGVVIDTPHGTATLTGPNGLLASFDGQTPQDRRSSFEALVGDELTLTVRAGLDVTAETGWEQAHANLRVGLAPPGLEVKAKYDADPSAAGFGAYLTGVKLPNVFTAASGDPLVKKVRFSIAGAPAAAATKALDKGKAAFPLDMGTLAAAANGDDRVYVVRAEGLDKNGVVRATFDGTATVRGRLGLDLRVTADGQAPRPVEEARLLAGTPGAPVLDFRPGIAGDIPTYYQGRLALSYFAAGVDKPERQSSIRVVTNGQGQLNSTVLGSAFKDRQSDPNDFDYDIVLTPGNNFRSGQTLHRFSEPEHLRVVTAPDWLKVNAGKTGKFAVTPGSSAQYGAGVGAYTFAINVRNDFRFKLPVLSNTPFEIFDKAELKNGAVLNADFSVYVPLFEAMTPVARADKVYAQADLLGDTLFEKTLAADRFEVLAPLDPRTVARPDSVTIRTAGDDPVSLLAEPVSFQRTFGPFEVSVPVFTAGIFSLNGTVKMKGTFEASLSELLLDGGVTLRFDENDRLAPGLTTGGFALDVAASATATLGAEASVSVDVFDYKLVNLVHAQGSGSITLGLTAHVEADYGPEGFVLDRNETRADLTVGYAFNYDISFLTKDPTDPPDMETAQDTETTSVWDLAP
ncbi:MAG TPA: hypothetical protein VM597_15705, partial [Gemmataceae bacterium]|nr:hypothetical protein [Gemmataceae bacterium]